jgi:hypothetical protein
MCAVNVRIGARVETVYRTVVGVGRFTVSILSVDGISCCHIVDDIRLHKHVRFEQSV